MKFRGISRPVRTGLIIFCGLLSAAINLNGQDWVRTSAPFQLWSGIACSSNGAKIIASSRFADHAYNPGGLYVSSNSGRTWTLTSPPVQYWDRVASSADGVKLIASGGPTDSYIPHPRIYMSTDSGATWTQSSAPAADWGVLNSSADGSKLFGAVANAGIYYSWDSGVTWTSANVPVRYWQALNCSADGKVIVASGGDLNAPSKRDVYLSTDSGATWNLVIGAPTTIIALTTSADGGRWFGSGTGIVVSDDSAKDWSLTSAPVDSYEWLALATSADGHVATAVSLIAEPVSYSPGPIYTSTDYGKNWQQRGTVSGYFNTIACSSDGAKWIAAEGGFAPGYIYTFQTAPSLSIQPSGKDVLLSWPASATDFSLQQNDSLTTSSGWVPVTNSVTLGESGFRCVLPRDAAQNYFRLVAQ